MTLVSSFLYSFIIFALLILKCSQFLHLYISFDRNKRYLFIWIDILHWYNISSKPLKWKWWIYEQAYKIHVNSIKQHIIYAYQLLRLASGGKISRLKFQCLLGGFSVIDCIRRKIYIGEWSFRKILIVHLWLWDDWIGGSQCASLIWDCILILALWCFLSGLAVG